MLFQSAPPDTSAYMIAGYAVFTLVMLIYLASLFLRRRNLEQDLKTLQSLEADNRRSSSPASRAEPRPRATKPGRAKGSGRAQSRKKVTRRK